MAAPYGPPLGQAYAGAPPPPGPMAGGLSPTAVQNALSLKTWTKFIGIFSMIAGGLYCLTIVGIIFGWLPILLGYFLHKASGEIETYANTGQQPALEGAISSLRLYFMILGIMLIVWLCLVVLILIMYLIIGAAMLAAIGAGR